MMAWAYGRLGGDPKRIETRTGTPMAVASLAAEIDPAREGEHNEPLWVGVIAFGRVAEDLLRHKKGDLCGVGGRLQRNRWSTDDGEQKERLQIVADSIASAKTIRPRGGRSAGGRS